MVCPAFSPAHDSGDSDVIDIGLPSYDVVQHVPMSGPWMHPGVFILVMKLEDGVGDDKFMFGT